MLPLIIAFVLVVFITIIYFDDNVRIRGSYEPKLDKDDLAEIKFISEHFEITQKPIYEMSQLDSLKYRKSKFANINCHAGQRKLLLTEVQFYTAVSEDLIIYSGSAPNDHISVILKMFPTKKFILIDPAYHNINEDYTILYQNLDVIDPKNLKTFEAATQSKDAKIRAHAARLLKAPFYGDKSLNMISPDVVAVRNQMKQFQTKLFESVIDDIMKSKTRIFIIQDYLGPAMIDLFKKALGDTKFSYVSDIRSTAFSHIPTDIDYIWNDALQLYFIKELRPQKSMLKFHPPYMDNLKSYSIMNSAERAKNPFHERVYQDIQLVKSKYNLDMLANYKNRKHEYLQNSMIYLQAWSPVSSSETRLIVTLDDIDKPFINYDHDDWDNRFYYLRRLRTYGYFDQFYKHIRSRNNHRYYGDFDSMLELFILGNYCLKNTELTMSADAVEQLLVDNLESILKLGRIIDELELYESIDSIKCGFRDQHKTPLKDINLFWIDDKKLYKTNKSGRLLYIRPIQKELNLASNTTASPVSVKTMIRVMNKRDD